MTTRLSRSGKGRYRHDGLGVEIEKTSMPDHPWELCGADPHGSGVVLARTLSDARAFLREVEAHIDQAADGRSIEAVRNSLALLALGHAVHYERERRGISVVALAAEVGVKATRIEALEAGRLDADYELLVKLTDALAIGLGDLVRRAQPLAVGGWAPESDSPSHDANAAALLALHRYLYPERYADVPTHVWDAGTIVEVAEMIERALAHHPDARLERR